MEEETPIDPWACLSHEQARSLCFSVSLNDHEERAPSADRWYLMVDGSVTSLSLKTECWTARKVLASSEFKRIVAVTIYVAMLVF